MCCCARDHHPRIVQQADGQRLVLCQDRLRHRDSSRLAEILPSGHCRGKHRQRPLRRRRRGASAPPSTRRIAGRLQDSSDNSTGSTTRRTESSLQRGVSPRLRRLLPRATLRTSPCARPGATCPVASLPAPRSTAEARPRVRRWEAKARWFARIPSASCGLVQKSGPETPLESPLWPAEPVPKRRHDPPETVDAPVTRGAALALRSWTAAAAGAQRSCPRPQTCAAPGKRGTPRRNRPAAPPPERGGARDRRRAARGAAAAASRGMEHCARRRVALRGCRRAVGATAPRRHPRRPGGPPPGTAPLLRVAEHGSRSGVGRRRGSGRPGTRVPGRPGGRPRRAAGGLRGPLGPPLGTGRRRSVHPRHRRRAHRVSGRAGDPRSPKSPSQPGNRSRSSRPSKVSWSTREPTWRRCWPTGTREASPRSWRR